MKTYLFDRHVALGAKIVSFAGWEMPISYKGVLIEHQAVREAVGLFDVSHMGRIDITGGDAERFLDYLSTNCIAGQSDGTAIYTVLCQEEGGSIDDAILYRQDKERFFLVVNAGNRQKDLSHLISHQRDFDVRIIDRFSHNGILALQGPKAKALLQLLFPEVDRIKPMRFIELNRENQDVTISRTGYTGAGGFELYGREELLATYWDVLLEKGKAFGIEPIGLGARDTLRLEMGFALYGHELSEAIKPNESVSKWTIKWKDRDFLGKNALEALERDAHKRNQYGIQLLESGIAREGCLVFQHEKPIGKVVSGSFSPTLNCSIAIMMVDRVLNEGAIVHVQIRQKQCQARIVNLPFIRKNS